MAQAHPAGPEIPQALVNGGSGKIPSSRRLGLMLHRSGAGHRAHHLSNALAEHGMRWMKWTHAPAPAPARPYAKAMQADARAKQTSTRRPLSTSSLGSFPSKGDRLQGKP